jgi:hypothetical protein
VFTKNQESNIFSLYDPDGNTNILQLLIDNGTMRLRSLKRNQALGIVWYTSNSDSNGSNSNMYEPGWNLICYVTGASWSFYSYPHFSATPNTDTATYYTFHGTGKRGMFGGAKPSGDPIREFEGIIHSAFFKEAYLTNTQIKNNFLPPRLSPFTCDYFTGMFADLTTTDASDYFENKLSNYNGHAQTFKNNPLSVLHPTNGLTISSGQTFTIEQVKVTAQRALSVHLWFKGSFTDGSRIVTFSKDSTNKNLIMSRSGSDFVILTTEATTVTITLSGVIGSIVSTSWVYISASIGWMGRGDNFMICAYVYQATNYDQGD